MGCLADCLTSLYHYCFDYPCRYCKMTYSKKWYDIKNRQCFFCYHFHSVYHTKAYMLKNIKMYYELSHNTNKLTYYEEYLDQLCIWCDHYGIESTSESIELEHGIEEEIMRLKIFY